MVLNQFRATQPTTPFAVLLKMLSINAAGDGARATTGKAGDF